MKNNNVMVLIDTRSTNNFFDTNFAKILNIFTYPIPNMKVMVVDGKKIEGVG